MIRRLASTPAALVDISRLVHDATLDSDAQPQIDADGNVRIEFSQTTTGWPELPQAEEVARTLLTRIEKVPTVRGCLRVGHVVKLDCHPDWPLTGSLLDIRVGEATMVVVDSGVALRLTVSALDVEATLADEVTGWIRRRRWPWGTSEVAWSTPSSADSE